MLYSLIGFWGVIFVTYTMTWEYINGAFVRSKSTGESYGKALYHLISKNKIHQSVGPSFGQINISNWIDDINKAVAHRKAILLIFRFRKFLLELRLFKNPS